MSIPAQYTVCLNTTGDIGLLFSSSEVIPIARDPALTALFPQGFFVTRVGGAASWRDNRRTVGPHPHVLVAATPTTNFYPDEAGEDTPQVSLYIAGALRSFDLRTRFNNCLSLFKAVGCRSCPDAGVKCLADEAKITPPPPIVSALSDEETAELVGVEHPTIAGHAFVSPKNTRRNPFEARIRQYLDHDFVGVEANKKAASKRAHDAAETKKFKKVECSQCPVSVCCDRASHCKGRYPEVQIIEQQCNDELDACIKLSEFPAWQIWNLARGVDKRTKHSRWNILLGGVLLQGAKGLVPVVYRTRATSTKYPTLKTYEEIAKAFDLPGTEEESAPPPEDRGLRAAWWLALNAHGESLSYGWGCRRSVLASGFEGGAVSVLWHNWRVVVHYSTLYGVVDVAARIGRGRLTHIDNLKSDLRT